MTYSKDVQKKIIFLILILIIFFFFWRNQKNNQMMLKAGDCLFKVEVVNDDFSHYQGLSNRDSLCPDCAMLFLFPEADNLRFVMRNMNFPLDIIFIKNGKVLNYYQNALPEGSSPQKTYSSADLADTVLELNAGQIKKCKISINQEISFSQ
jgi:uncharacterized protein